MSRIIKRHPLKRKDAKSFITKIYQIFGVDIKKCSKKPKIEFIKTQETEYYLINGKIILMRKNKEILPTLLFDEYLSLLPKVSVDLGAIPHVCNGADIMAPGIAKIDGEFKKGSKVLIIDERHQKPLALGKALEDSEKIRRIKHGKVIENIHYVGDKHWKFIKIFDVQ
ncbi:TPA: DUF1947 domain-containing protein [Candidatus Bathyarchaeota archaeon]|nr:DUF1947 domain-containing protein [Candidatus Bathyarchaeota archaeon]